MIDFNIELLSVKNAIAKLDKVSDSIDVSKLLLPIGFDILAKIKVRTAEGMDSSGNKFEPYSQSYESFLNRKGLPSKDVDLFFSGRMQSSMDVEVLDANSVRLFFNNPNEGLKAFDHHTGTGRLPKREFFSLSNDDKEYISKALESAIDTIVGNEGLG